MPFVCLGVDFSLFSGLVGIGSGNKKKRVSLLFISLGPRHHRFCDYSTHDINEEQREKLLPKTLDVKSYEGNVEQICESYDELVNEIFKNDTVFIPLARLMAFHFSQFLHGWPVHVLIETIGD